MCGLDYRTLEYLLPGNSDEYCAAGLSVAIQMQSTMLIALKLASNNGVQCICLVCAAEYAQSIGE